MTSTIDFKVKVTTEKNSHSGTYNQMARKLLLGTCVLISIVIVIFTSINLKKRNNLAEQLSETDTNNDSHIKNQLAIKNIAIQSIGVDPSDKPIDIASMSRNMETAGLVTVHGQVSDNNAKAISGIQVEISSTTPSATPKQIHATTTDDSGNFTISHVPQGNDYRLEVLALGAYAGNVLEQVVVEPNMALLSVSLDTLELVSIDGTIVGTDYLPVADFEILVRNIGIAYPGDNIVTDSAGLFQLNQFPAGEIQLSTNGDEHFEINGITLSTGEYRNTTLVLDKGNNELSGNVVDSFGHPIEQARIVATSKFSGGNYESSSYRLKVTDNNGYFSFTNLGEWDRQLVVDATGYQTNTLQYSFQTQSDTLTVQLLRSP